MARSIRFVVMNGPPADYPTIPDVAGTGDQLSNARARGIDELALLSLLKSRSQSESFERPDLRRCLRRRTAM
jgi:hypothetical protein